MYKRIELELVRARAELNLEHHDRGLLDSKYKNRFVYSSLF